MQGKFAFKHLQYVSAIDLTLCSRALASKLSWRTPQDLCDSDQYSLLRKPLSTKNSHPPRWLTDRADWTCFKQLTADTASLPDLSDPLIAVETFTQFVINAAVISIPQTTGYCKPNRVPWWSKEISLAIRARKKAHRKYKSALP